MVIAGPIIGSLIGAIAERYSGRVILWDFVLLITLSPNRHT